MSMWGAGIRQCDEFEDVYEEFFDKYIGDASPESIFREILNEYQQAYSEQEGFLYPVYYALAQCLWECGCKDNWLWDRITQIVENETDVAFWKELECDASFARRRQTELMKFLDKLHSVPYRIRKAKKITKKRQPSLEKGLLFAYSCQDGYRVALVLDQVSEQYLLAITDAVFTEIPNKDQVLESDCSTVFWCVYREVPPKKERLLITVLELDEDYNGRAGYLNSPSMVGCSNYGVRDHFYDPKKAAASMKRNQIGCYRMKNLLRSASLPKYQPRREYRECKRKDLRLFIRMICHKDAVSAKKAAMKALAAELFGEEIAALEAHSYWKDPDFFEAEASLMGESFGLAAVCKFAAGIAGKNSKVEIQTQNGEVLICNYCSMPEMIGDTDLAFVECGVLDESVSQ